MTGNSGGGTLSSYVTALDPRPTMAAPSCFICSYEANLQNELPSDAEQNPPGIIGRGMDQGHHILQLIAEAECTARLVKCGTTPYAAGEALV